MTAAPLDRLAQRLNLAARQQRAPVAFTPPSAPPAAPAVERLAYSVAEAAAAVGVCTRTLRSWPLPRVRVGGRVLILRSDLDRWLAEHREEGRHAG